MLVQLLMLVLLVEQWLPEYCNDEWPIMVVAVLFFLRFPLHRHGSARLQTGWGPLAILPPRCAVEGRWPRRQGDLVDSSCRNLQLCL